MMSRIAVLSQNVLNVTSLVRANLQDDPGNFVLQVARRFKRIVRRLPIASLVRLPISEVKVRGFLCLLGDQSSDLESLLNVWKSSSRSVSDGLFLSDVCIAMHKWDLAEQVLKFLPDSTRTQRRRARLHWQLGELTKALKLLEEAGSSRQYLHYLSEFRTLCGADPILQCTESKSQNASSESSDVLYFATNSLPATGSGYAQRTHSILCALVERDCVPVAVTRAQYPVNIGHVFAREQDKVGAITYRRIFPFPARHDLSGLLQQQTEELLKLALRSRPTVLHTTTDYSNALSVRAVARELNIPWIYEVRGQLADTWASTRGPDAKQSERYRLFTAREAELARSADRVVTLGESMKSNLIAAGVNADKIDILPNAVGERFLEDPLPRSNARQRLALEEGAFYVGTISSIVPYEGLDIVLRAAALIKDEIPLLRVLIVGDGAELENLRKLAVDLDIERICHFPGRVPRHEAHAYHAALNVFVVPRRDLEVTRAVTPLKPVEALASRVPVLASDLPALRELIVDGENGHLVEPGDERAWADAIVQAQSQPELLDSMGQRGRELVLNTRTWDANARHLVEIYEQVTKESR
ncbi:glycosyltransferase family 4 protein [Glutamicibacter sp. PS]|uniref:glycosyltransferase family 4 protein n=1 Tax=Glutamicibacter sp. PS TaxID=3075634 RepID=UPI002852D8C8|nr:glycosyltransferase family 4 protein [Glutamicibacter sp. PS]